MKKHPVFVYLLGVLTSMLLFSFASPAIAAVTSKMVEIFPGITVYINDVRLNPKDANGNPVEVFAYNGTTYLPVRAIGEAFGETVQWDGNTRSVYIGYHNPNINYTIPSSNPTPSPAPTAPTTPTTSSTPTPSQSANPAPAASPIPTTNSTPAPSQSTSNTVYITRTGKRYHYSSTCNGGTYYRSTLQEARSRGLTPCNKCVN